MKESEKEYEYRCIIGSILSYFEDKTGNYDELCDCTCKNGYHGSICKTSLIREDVKMFVKEVEKIRVR